MVMPACLNYLLAPIWTLGMNGTAVIKLCRALLGLSVGYDDGNMNPIVMDTFFVKADFGSIVAKRMEQTRAKQVITKIGFGNVLLDFDNGKGEKCSVDASVGAGNLEVLLPKEVLKLNK